MQEAASFKAGLGSGAREGARQQAPMHASWAQASGRCAPWGRVWPGSSYVCVWGVEYGVCIYVYVCIYVCVGIDPTAVGAV